MNIEEMKTLKSALERDVERRLRAFRAATGVSVTALDMERHVQKVGSGEIVAEEYSVEVTVQL